MYASHTLTKLEMAYAQIEHEGLALVFVTDSTNIYMDNLDRLSSSLKIFSSKESTPTMAAAMMQRWALTLSVYQYTIEHIKGTSNQCADCMND